MGAVLLRGNGHSKPESAVRRLRSALAVTPRGSSCAQPDAAAHGVGEVGQADPLRPRQADGADDERHRPLLMGEYVFDGSADLGLRRVGAARALGHRLAFGLPAMNARDETARLQHCLVLGRAVGGVGPHVARRVRRVEHVGQSHADTGDRVGRSRFADQPMLVVDADMVLIADSLTQTLPLRKPNLPLWSGMKSLALAHPAPGHRRVARI